jgi:hypothetical protein
MIALLCFFLTLFATPFKSKSRLVAENAVKAADYSITAASPRVWAALSGGLSMMLA